MAPLTKPFVIASKMIVPSNDILQRTPINIRTLYKNPMFVIGLLTIFTIFAMPYITPSPEEMAALQRELGIRKDVAPGTASAEGSETKKDL